MADASKTQKPTPKRIKEFRKRGDVALSRDVVSAATFAGGAIALIATASTGFGAIKALAKHVANSADGLEHDGLGHEAFQAFESAAFPIVIGAAVAAFVACALQLGWPPAFKGIKIDLNRLNPLANLQNTFGLNSVARRTGGAAAKLLVVALVVSTAFTGITKLHPSSAQDLVSMIGSTITRVLELVIGALLAIGAVDYYFAKKKLNDQMMMSPDEIKREHKESEGDPHIKGKRRQKMRELAKRRMAKAVATADVIVVNPTHYAVALKYDEAKFAAPLVVAKGVDEQAEKIRAIARKHGVPVISRPPLTRALYKLVKEGKPVPQNLYRAVAEVLAYVYRIKNGGRA
ncbi:MAG: EscU/YscU/HrcU family type III secretion system export apparatus switch protein [Kofleriaceae bacterium]